MASQPTWQGVTGTLVPEGGWEKDIYFDRTTAQRSWIGKYTLCEAAQPAIGSTIAGLPESLRVEHVKLVELGATEGRMTVFLSTFPGQTLLGPQEPEYDVDYQRVQKNIRSHPRYNGGPWEGGHTTLNEENFHDIEQALADRAKEKSPGVTYLSVVQANTFMLELYKKIRSGHDSYDVWAPVVTKSSQHQSSPGVGSCGTIQNPPAAAGPPPGYKWLKSADKKHRGGRYWERHEEWTGAEVIDNTTYATL